MEQGIVAFLIWLITRLERPLRRLCTPPLPAATIILWWVRRLRLHGRPGSGRLACRCYFRPATLPYLLYPLTCSLLE